MLQSVFHLRRFLGLSDRGRLQADAYADLVVLI